MAMSLPQHYDSANARRWDYNPVEAVLFEAAQQYANDNKIKPAASDQFTIEVLGIDLQRDFCFPEGTLYVGGRSGTGAMDDNDRIAQFMYRNLPYLTAFTPTMDTHVPVQIFFPSFWVDQDGKPIQPHTMITTADIRDGKYRPSMAAINIANGNLPWLMDYVRWYCDQLEQQGKYTLYIWPYHCMLGGAGHTLSGVIQEARIFHTFARGTQSTPMVKGTSPFTENYSVFRPEVLQSHDGRPVGQRDVVVLEKMLKRNAVVVLGQAASHCVLSSIDDILGDILKRDPGLASKIYVVKDCMSAVTVPKDPKNWSTGGFYADFTPNAEAAFQKFADAGMHLVESTTDIRDWPGMKL